MSNNSVKTALVTGGSSGIGQGIAAVLAQNGYDIAITYNEHPAGADITRELVERHGRRFYAIRAALDEEEAAETAVKEAISLLGRLDLLVNNAGVTRHHHLLTITGEDLDFLYRLNYRSYVLAAAAAARHMYLNQIKGNIIFITSSRGDRAYPNDPHYGGLKAAVKRACESFALQMAPYGIRVNAIAPGATQVRPGSDHADELGRRIPLERLGQAEDIGHAVSFLASDKASYITGITLRIDGGLILAGMPEAMREMAADAGWGRPVLPDDFFDQVRMRDDAAFNDEE